MPETLGNLVNLTLLDLGEIDRSILLALEQFDLEWHE